MKASNIRLALAGALIAIACGDAENDTPKTTCDGGACTSGGSAGVGAVSGASGRGGAGGSSGVAGTGPSGSGGTSSPDAGGRGGSPSGGSSGMTGSGGTPVRDGSPDFDAPPSDASDASSEEDGRQCVELAQMQDSATCTLAVCRRGTTIEISATHSDHWYVGALVWMLSVCDVVLTRSRSPDFMEKTLVYDATEQEWARMREGDPVAMHYGTPPTPAGARGLSCGKLTKNVQNCAP